MYALNNKLLKAKALRSLVFMCHLLYKLSSLKLEGALRSLALMCD